MKLDIRHYLGVFWRRFPYFIVVASLCASIGLTLAVILPAEYSARATLLIESAQIPEELAASTVVTVATEQLEIIEQRLMTRQNLLDVANRLEIYPEDSELSASAIVADLRSRTTFESSEGRGRATILRISFAGTSSNQAAEVTNEFVTLILQENIESRTNRAGDTLEFFEQEVERLGSDLDTQSERILDFKTENADALPESEEFLRSQRTTTQDRVNQLAREITALEEQRLRIVEIYERTGGFASDEVALSPQEQALLQARADLENALLVFSAQNPKVKLLQARVAQLEQKMAGETSTETVETNPETSTAAALIEAQLAEIDFKLEGLNNEVEERERLLVSFDESLGQIPSNAITLDKLERDLLNSQGQYNRAVASLSQAKTGERIELLAKGQRLAVVEQATAPDSPVKPNRTLIAGAGVGAGIALGLGLVVLLELLNRSIRRPVELTDKLGITPLAVLPYIRTERETTVKRLILFGTIAFLVVLLPVGLYWIHTSIMSLDTLIEPVANRLGFSVSQ